MPVYAGQTVTAGQINRIQPVPYFAEATGTLSTGTTYALIPGCTLTVATSTANARWTSVGTFDCAVAATHLTNLMVGRLTVAGTGQTGLAIHALDTLDRDTVVMSWSGTLGSPGETVFNMEGVNNGTGGSGVFQMYSRLMVTVFEVV